MVPQQCLPRVVVGVFDPVELGTGLRGGAIQARPGGLEGGNTLPILSSIMLVTMQAMVP